MNFTMKDEHKGRKSIKERIKAPMGRKGLLRSDVI
jgi:hypothetical protein